MDKSPPSKVSFVELILFKCEICYIFWVEFHIFVPIKILQICMQVSSSTTRTSVPPPFHSPTLPTFHPLFFPNYGASPVLGHLASTLGTPLSTPMVLSSPVQPMGVYHHPPPLYLPSHPSTMVSPI
jgi:hypothetical protein